MQDNEIQRFDWALWLIVQQLGAVSNSSFIKLLECIQALSLELQAPDSWPKVKRLLSQFKVAPRALEVVEALYAQQEHADLGRIKRQLNWMQQQQVLLLAWSDSQYPRLLRHIAQPPALLYLQGAVRLLNCPQIAVVGARRATPVGLKSAYLLSQELARSGLVITSGLALGVDGCGHRAALEQGLPTIAVLGTGLDVIYPKQHLSLAKEIIQGGLLLSEFALGSAPRRHHFPQRNRLLSGLSLGVLVVEASARSGSLITAKFALEQGREVFAVPGSIHNAMAQGCHELIKQGACLIDSSEAIVEVLQSSSLLDLLAPLDQASVSGVDNKQSSSPPPTYNLQQPDSDLYAYIEDQGSSVEELHLSSGQSIEQISKELMALELAGKIKSQMGLYFKI